MALLLALLLVLAPFLGLRLFKVRAEGLVVVLFLSILLHLGVGIATQLTHTFNYGVVFSLHIVILLILAWRAGFKKLFVLPKLQTSSLLTQNWWILGVLGVASLYLGMTHFNYSGTISLLVPPSYQEVSQFSYPYPYYSDEWFSIALSQDAIKNSRLPIFNPLLRKEPRFTNLQLPFHSLIAELQLLLGVPPISSYIYLSFAVNLLVINLCYLLLRQLGASKLAAGLGALSVLFITNGANLPGLWNLIALNMGILLFLICLFGMSCGRKNLVVASLGTTLLFYPPLLVFAVPAVAVWILNSKQLSQPDRKRVLWRCAVVAIVAAALVVGIFFATPVKDETIFSYIVQTKLFYASFTGDFMPQYAIWNVMYWPILLIAGYGIYPLLSKYRWLAVAIGFGGVFWLIYSVVPYRFIIEYTRVVVVTAILTSVVFGLGVQQILELLRDSSPKWVERKKGIVMGGLLLVIGFFSLVYTARNPWKKLLAVNYSTGIEVQAAAPVNGFLTVDDLVLFQDIKGAKFLSLPWKGTVIGVATQNYPVLVKEGTLSIEQINLSAFFSGSCAERTQMVKQIAVEYLYLPPISCDEFEKVGESSEGLVLYKVL